MSRQHLIDLYVDTELPPATIKPKEWGWLRPVLDTDRYRTCEICGVELFSSRALTCSGRCKKRRDRQKESAAARENRLGWARRSNDGRWLRTPGPSRGWPWADEYATPWTGCSDACRCARSMEQHVGKMTP